jgi:hypothetical protein
VTEARKLGIPVVAILDTNCDPDEVDYPIPGNDDAIRAGSLLTRIVADAVAEGLRLRSVYASEAAGKEGAATISASPADEEPLAEWERELLESDSGSQAETARFGRTDGAAAAASADQPASSTSARSGSQSASGARRATQSRGEAGSAPESGGSTQSKGKAEGARPPRPPRRSLAPRAQAAPAPTATGQRPTPKAKVRPAPSPATRPRPRPRLNRATRLRRTPRPRPRPSPTTRRPSRARLRPTPAPRARPRTPPRSPLTPRTRRGNPGPSGPGPGRHWERERSKEHHPTWRSRPLRSRPSATPPGPE